MAAGDAAPKRAALSDEMLLADELVEAPRPHPRRERLLLGRWLEQRLGLGAGQSGRGAPGGHGPMVRDQLGVVAIGSDFRETNTTDRFRARLLRFFRVAEGVDRCRLNSFA
jgi:hypothetical protein